ncbi:MAG: hypothetical protein PUD39_04445 [Bacteroidales bacterium]|nr:hypothetical protein [Bacteroidales bacterium]
MILCQSIASRYYATMRDIATDRRRHQLKGQATTLSTKIATTQIGERSNNADRQQFY